VAAGRPRASGCRPGRLVQIIRRVSGSVVTWRRAQMVLLSAQGMDAAAIGKVAFTSEDRVRDVIRNFNADGLISLYPKYKGGHPPKFTLGQRRETKKIAKSKPAEHDLPFSGACRGQVHRAALLHARRDRPCQSQGTGQHHPPVHHLAQQPLYDERLRRIVDKASSLTRH